MKPDWRAHIEVASALVLTAALVGVNERWSPGFLEPLLKDNRGAVYGTMASIAGTMLGFVMAAYGIVLTAVGARQFARFRAGTAYLQLWSVFGRAVTALSLATLATLLALIIDRDARPRMWAAYACTCAYLLAIARLINVAQALRLVVVAVHEVHQRQAREELSNVNQTKEPDPE